MKAFATAMLAMIAIAVVSALALDQVDMSSSEMNAKSNVRLN